MESWHANQVIYQIYPKSFQDSNEDGVGDIQGIIQRIPYLKSLGITTIWLNPIYVSPQVDNGYDVSNYYAIDETLGSMADVDLLIKRLHIEGMHLIMDFVMNHTSDQHLWFKDAIQHPHGLYRDYYLWANAKGDGYPNNWGSFFGGSVWSIDPGTTDQYYFHLFDRHMPDLNWHNPEVRNSMLEIAKYWIEKGIDGLRLDAFIHIEKANFNQDVPNDSNKPVIAEEFYAHLPRVQTYLKQFCAQLRAIKPDIFILGEAASASPELLMEYSRPVNGECDAVITFKSLVDKVENPDIKLPTTFQLKQLDIEGMKRQLAAIETKLADVSLPVLYWSNHDMARLASRYASKCYRLQSLKCLATMLYLQRGIPIIYYGEEIGMQNLSQEQPIDFCDQTVIEFYKQALKQGYSHDDTMRMLNHTHKIPARGGMQWDLQQTNAGFSEHVPWLDGTTIAVDVATEQTDPHSLLSYYRTLIKLKKTELFTDGIEIIENTTKGVFQFTRQLGRSVAVVTCNLTDQSLDIPQIPAAHLQMVEGEVQPSGDMMTYGPWAFTIKHVLEE
ncbi:alpha-glucosidase [Lactiplantibacillus plantarum]|uniref:alpha-glucosidase n=1 Tax=Lactiplantibacillus plantarum TaxID=1590 RepID=UPI00034E4ECB|nr:alpha-glucosidase [Lactiplantibacillus plantarum]EPD24209.1 Oligo-1,6-glucosidase [Lactiplantibacillus plantarum IPLA88]KZT83568.1 Oligo-1 6-glucosidase [Lactiplantibacillus plantarum]KZT91895.1 Oligo-1 6-glucosidase [Lactiplantibacillus plantarum]KZU38577.1 Oligo-1 6-glucosidase [Lactiplantibacillus plantarum]KZU41785.1 Oligo-1 6-glucosidase [Lactiplantibacillus plantarum]